MRVTLTVSEIAEKMSMDPEAEEALRSWAASREIGALSPRRCDELLIERLEYLLERVPSEVEVEREGLDGDDAA